MTQKTPPQNNLLFDVRIRERNLKSGVLTEKELEKHLASLPDVADQAEPFATSQPALEEPEDLDDESDDAGSDGAAAEG